jgi:hypothetical protein
VIDQTAATLALRNRALSLVVATTGSQTLSATANGYARSSGSFLTDGFADGMEFVPAGFSDVTPKVIESVSALSIVTTTATTAQGASAGRSLTVGFPATQGLDNRRVKPISGEPYTEEEFVPGGHSLMGTTSGYEQRRRTLPGSSTTARGEGRRWHQEVVRCAEGSLRSGHQSGRWLEHSPLRTDVSVKSGQILPQGNGWAVCTVTVPWWALSNNAVAA